MTCFSALLQFFLALNMPLQTHRVEHPGFYMAYPGVGIHQYACTEIWH